MAKVSPMVRSFNAGVFSELMEGRTDLDRYPASMRRAVNVIAAPQGPAICRSGTQFVTPVFDHDAQSYLLSFIFSDEQAQVLELAEDRIRFINEDGLQVYDAVATTTSTTSPFVVDSASLAAEPGDDIALSGYPDDYNLNGEIVRVLDVAGTEYTLDFTWPVGKATANGSAARVYHILSDFTDAQRAVMRVVQSVDLMYLLSGSQPRQLARYGTYDWRLSPLIFEDGPYLPINETATKLTPSSTGNAVPDMTGNTAPAGTASGSGNRPHIDGGSAGSHPFLKREIEYDLAESQYWYAFSSDEDVYWAGSGGQKGYIQYDFGAAVSIDGYAIYVPKDHSDSTYAAKDYAPSTFDLLGSTDGSTWVIVDRQNEYLLYDGYKTRFLKFPVPVEYRYWRLNITSLVSNGRIEPRVRRLVLRGTSRGAAQALDLSGGTTIGNADARQDNAFDGITTQLYTKSAQKNNAAANNMYIGKTLADAAAVLSAKVYGPRNAGFADGTQSVTLTLYGKNGTAPANGTDGTAIGAITFNDTSDERAGRTIPSTDTTTYWDHVWVRLTQANNADLWITEIKLNGWVDGAFVSITASSTEGINQDQGFLATDVGRVLRVQGSDKAWRPLRIDSVVSSTVVTVAMEGEPFPDLEATTQWRLGLWSDTTGWPTCGDFFEDRLCLAGSVEYPDMFALSVTGVYTQFSPTDETGAVLDDSGVVGRINARKLAGIRWLVSDEKGLLIGTGSSEYLISSAKGETEALTARNIKARSSTSRGSANVEPVKIDRQVLYVQRTGRTLRELAYVFEADGYKSPSMSQLASHLGVKRFVELAYAAEPHSIVWIRREDGSVVGLTYNREENVVGWHTHDFSGGEVESMAVIPAADQLQDTLWMVVKRTVDGNTRRYVERLTRFWDFDMEIDEAHYLDCALRYQGSATTLVYGLQHLEGEEVYVLADNKPAGPLTVADGAITLPFASESVLVGLGYDSEGETSRLENGAQDGTAIGKPGRVRNVSLLTWASSGGEVGVWSEEGIDPATNRQGVIKYEPVEYPHRADEAQQPTLYTGEVGPFVMAPGFDKRNSLSFRRPKASPLPFNVTAIMPQLEKEDRG